ncbi:MAG: PadR family transcriptional regulator [Collinsella sp.]|nr:PadR family transcriptional regulator [Collinsella sp.]
MAARDAASDLIRGNIDAIILRVLADGDSYGYEILKEIAEASRGEYEMKEPSLYTSLKRLERQGFVESYWGDETQGARRKYYRVTESGSDELKEATERWVRVRSIIDCLLKQDGGDK